MWNINSFIVSPVQVLNIQEILVAINKERKAKGLDPIPDNRWTKALGIFITFNTVMLSFLIFSGFLDQQWFPKLK